MSWNSKPGLQDGGCGSRLEDLIIRLITCFLLTVNHREGPNGEGAPRETGAYFLSRTWQIRERLYYCVQACVYGCVCVCGWQVFTCVHSATHRMVVPGHKAWLHLSVWNKLGFYVMNHTPTIEEVFGCGQAYNFNLVLWSNCILYNLSGIIVMQLT